MSPQPDVDIEFALQRLGVPLATAEAHGLAVGLGCSRSAASAKSRWFAELLDAAGLGAGALAERAPALHTLDGWFEATLQALNSADLGFEPLLPDDDVALASRLDALGDFCAGFAYGIGLGAAQRGNAPLPEDTAEILKDLQAIDGAERGGHASAGAPDGDAVTEDDYAELVEYVRVGVLTVLEELRPVARSASAGGDAPLH